MTENEIRIINGKEIVLYREIETDLYRLSKDAVDVLLKAFEEKEQYEAIGTIDEFKDLKEKNNKDFELLLKAVKESYPIFKGAYVELDFFMGDVIRRFIRDKQTLEKSQET